MAKYSKAIAAALGGGVATIAGIFLGWSPEQITTQTVAITGALGVFMPLIFTFFSPKNAN